MNKRYSFLLILFQVIGDEIDYIVSDQHIIFLYIGDVILDKYAGKCHSFGILRHVCETQVIVIKIAIREQIPEFAKCM